MKADVVRVVQTYIDAVTRNDPSALPLHDAFEFISPPGNTQGALPLEPASQISSRSSRALKSYDLPPMKIRVRRRWIWILFSELSRYLSTFTSLPNRSCPFAHITIRAPFGGNAADTLPASSRRVATGSMVVSDRPLSECPTRSCLLHATFSPGFPGRRTASCGTLTATTPHQFAISTEADDSANPEARRHAMPAMLSFAAYFAI